MAEDFEAKRQKKIVRALVRLKHSLQADEEIERFLTSRQQIIDEGGVPQLDVTLDDILKAD